jgi:hypothetical protein
MVTLTNEEFDALSPEAQKAHQVAEEKIVFGHDFKKVKGQPVEQGIGSPGRETGNHFASLKKAESLGIEEPGAYAAAVAELWKRDPERAKRLNLPKPQPKAG